MYTSYSSTDKFIRRLTTYEVYSGLWRRLGALLSTSSLLLINRAGFLIHCTGLQVHERGRKAVRQTAEIFVYAKLSQILQNTHAHGVTPVWNGLNCEKGQCPLTHSLNCELKTNNKRYKRMIYVYRSCEHLRLCCRNSSCCTSSSITGSICHLWFMLLSVYCLQNCRILEQGTQRTMQCNILCNFLLTRAIHNWQHKTHFFQYSIINVMHLLIINI